MPNQSPRSKAIQARKMPVLNRSNLDDKENSVLIRAISISEAS